MLQRLSIALAQVKACLLNEIREIIYSLHHQAKEITKKVYNNISIIGKWTLYL